MPIIKHLEFVIRWWVDRIGIKWVIVQLVLGTLLAVILNYTI